jgi:hypothetical protein
LRFKYNLQVLSNILSAAKSPPLAHLPRAPAPKVPNQLRVRSTHPSSSLADAAQQLLVVTENDKIYYRLIVVNNQYHLPAVDQDLREEY